MDTHDALKHFLVNHPRAARHIKWLMLWDKSLTLSENMRICKIPNQPSATNFCRLYNVGFREGYHRKVRTKAESLKVLLKNGLKMSDIARLMDVSPQRIGQLLNPKT